MYCVRLQCHERILTNRVVCCEVCKCQFLEAGYCIECFVFVMDHVAPQLCVETVRILGWKNCLSSFEGCNRHRASYEFNLRCGPIGGQACDVALLFSKQICIWIKHDSWNIANYTMFRAMSCSLFCSYIWLWKNVDTWHLTWTIIGTATPWSFRPHVIIYLPWEEKCFVPSDMGDVFQ